MSKQKGRGSSTDDGIKNQESAPADPESQEPDDKPDTPPPEQPDAPPPAPAPAKRSCIDFFASSAGHVCPAPVLADLRKYAASGRFRNSPLTAGDGKDTLGDLYEREKEALLYLIKAYQEGLVPWARVMKKVEELADVRGIIEWNKQYGRRRTS